MAGSGTLNLTLLSGCMTPQLGHSPQIIISLCNDTLQSILETSSVVLYLVQGQLSLIPVKTS